MNQKDKIEFIKEMGFIGEITRGELSKAALEVYWELLKPYPIEAVKEAGRGLLRERVYSGFPQPAEFIRQMEGAEEDFEALAILATDKMLRAIDRRAEISDPILEMVIDSKGGRNRVEWYINNLSTYDLQGYIKDMRVMYRHFVRMERKERKALTMGVERKALK